MGQFPKGSNPFFSVSPAGSAYALPWGQAQARLDVRYNHPQYARLNARLDAAAAPTPPLDDVLQSIASGATPKRSDESLYADADSGVKFLRILNVVDGDIVGQDGPDLKYVTAAVHNGELARSRLDAGDVLMTITGRVGSAAVVRPEHLPANINQHIARLRVAAERCRPQFLSEWLNCPAGWELANRYVSGGTRAALDYGAIRNLRIPLPPLAEQDRLIAAMDAARAARQANLADADALLAGIDDYLLDTLGVKLPSENRRRVFAVSLGDLGSRFDVRHHSMKGAFETTYPVVELGTLVWTEPDYGVSARAVDRTSNEEPRYIRITDFGFDGIEPGHEFLTADHIDKDSELALHDVLFARTGSVGKTYIHEDISEPAVFAGYCIRFRFDAARVLPKFVYWWTKTTAYARWVASIQRPSVQPNINKEEYKRCQIPLPTLDEQERIIAEIEATRQTARRLRAEGQAGWQAAKAWFEAQLL